MVTDSISAIMNRKESEWIVSQMVISVSIRVHPWFQCLRFQP